MRRAIVFLLAALLLMSASLPLIAQDTGGVARIRVAHLSPALPTAIIFVNREIAYSGLRYQSITRWREVEPGSYEVAVGSNSNIENAAVGPVTVEVEAGDYLTIAAYGNDNPNVTVIEESLDDLAEGSARVTVFHAIEGATPVDVLANGSTAIELLAYPGTVVNPDGLNDGITSIDVPAGSYDLQVVANGAPNTVLIDLPGTALDAGISYIVAAVGTTDAPDVVVATTDPAQFTATEEEDSGEEAAATEEPAEPVATEEAAATEEPAAPVATEEADAGEGEETAAGGTIAEIAMGNPDFSTLIGAVMGAPSVLEALTSGGTFTVFAPTNDAFAATLEAAGLTLGDVTGDTVLLERILKYHVVRGKLTSDMLRDGASIVTLSGDRIVISVADDGTVTINDTVTVVTADVEASDGVIHIIDGVLLPPTE
jgi:transforming growth factor-beta-induced protein